MFIYIHYICDLHLQFTIYIYILYLQFTFTIYIYIYIYYLQFTIYDLQFIVWKLLRDKCWIKGNCIGFSWA